MPIPLDDLIGSRIRSQPKTLTDKGLHFRALVRKRPHGAGKLSHRHFFSDRVQPNKMTEHILIPNSHFESKGDRFPVNSMGSPHHDGGPMLIRLFFQDGQQGLDVLYDDVHRARHLHRQGGVEDIR